MRRAGWRAFWVLEFLLLIGLAFPVGHLAGAAPVPSTLGMAQGSATASVAAIAPSALRGVDRIVAPGRQADDAPLPTRSAVGEGLAAPAISVTMAPDPICPAWWMEYTLWLTNTESYPLHNVVITSPLPSWPVFLAQVSDDSPLDGVYQEAQGLFVFQVPQVAPGQSVQARTLLRSYSTVSGELANAFYVRADEMAETVEAVHLATVDTSVCVEPTATPTPCPTGPSQPPPTVPAPTVPPPTVPPPTVPAPTPIMLYVPMMTCP